MFLEPVMPSVVLTNVLSTKTAEPPNLARVSISLKMTFYKIIVNLTNLTEELRLEVI